MRQKMRVTRTISTSVEEKDWKSCCPTCVMQVPPAPGLRALALLPPAWGAAKVRLRRQGGSASLSSLGARALMGAGLGGAGPKDFLAGHKVPTSPEETEPRLVPSTADCCLGGMCAQRREGAKGGQAGGASEGAEPGSSPPPTNVSIQASALFSFQGTRLQRE